MFLFSGGFPISESSHRSVNQREYLSKYIYVTVGRHMDNSKTALSSEKQKKSKEEEFQDKRQVLCTPLSLTCQNQVHHFQRKRLALAQKQTIQKTHSFNNKTIFFFFLSLFLFKLKKPNLSLCECKVFIFFSFDTLHRVLTDHREVQTVSPV